MTTYYVDGAVGNDANTGLAEGAGNAWATIGKMVTLPIVPGDHVYVKATVEYDEQVNIGTIYGTGPLPIVVEGYTTTPGDNGQVQWTYTTGSGCIYNSSSAGINHVYKNFIFQNGSADGVYLGLGDTIKFVNCNFKNNGRFGITADNSIYFVNCIAEGNAQHGLDADTGCFIIGCILRNNGYAQAFFDSATLAYKNLAYGHTNGTYNALNIGAGQFVIGNTVDAENAAIGIQMTQQQVNNIDNLVYKGGYSFSVPTGLTEIIPTWMNLISADPVTGAFDSAPAWTPYNLISTTDPGFTDRAGDNYAVANTSPAVGAGIVPGCIT